MSLRARGNLFFVFAGIFVISFVYQVFLDLVRMLVTGVAAVATDRGLIDRTGRFDFISWDEIRGAHLKKFGESHAILKQFGEPQLVALDLVDEGAVVSRQPLPHRLMLRIVPNDHSGAFSLNPAFFEGGANALLSLVKEKAAGK
jgi:hypothetical protein